MVRLLGGLRLSLVLVVWVCIVFGGFGIDFRLSCYLWR